MSVEDSSLTFIVQGLLYLHVCVTENWMVYMRIEVTTAANTKITLLQMWSAA
jgi:hypothetical protein